MRKQGKIGLAALAAAAALTVLPSCANPFRGYWSLPENAQAHVSLSDDSTILRAQANFAGDATSTDVDLTHTDSSTNVEGNEIEEQETALDLNIRPSNNRNFFVRPRFVTRSRDTPDSNLEAALFSTDLLWRFGMDNTNRLLVRPYGEDSRENIPLISDDITVAQRGIYLEGRFGMFVPLFSYETKDIDVLGSVTNITELQLGTALYLGSPGGRRVWSIGAYLVNADDGTEETSRLVMPGNLELGYDWGVLGFDGSYDGDLASLGAHLCIGRGGNTRNNVMALSDFVRNIQALNYLERGLSRSSARNRRFDSSRELERALEDARLILFLGARQQHNMAGDVEAEPYGYVGVRLADRHYLGVTYGPFLSFLPEEDKDIIREQFGVLYNAELADNVNLFALIDHRDNETADDSTRFQIGVIIPTN
jgi:hypothetical protein